MQISNLVLSGRRGLTFWGQLVIGWVLSAALLCVLAYWKNDEISSFYRVLVLLSAMGSVPVYSALNIYDRRDGYFAGLCRLAGGWFFMLLLLAVFAFLTKSSHQYSREVMIYWALGGLILQGVSYVPLHCLSVSYHDGLRSQRTSLIMGTGEVALRLADQLIRKMDEPVIGLVSTCETTACDTGFYPVLGSLADLPRLIQLHAVRRLYIAVPLAQVMEVERLYIELLDASIDVVWVPDVSSLLLLNHSVHSIGGMPAIHLNESPLTAYPTGALLKGALDRLGACSLLLMLAPIMLFIAALIKMGSPGPVLFRQLRTGWNGQVIEVWKFRSMVLHQDHVVRQATRDDPRVTPIGRFIRRTSLDELPQLFNVLQGTMSLVGPRPHAVAHNDYYSGKIVAYMARHRIKPGITGLAQVSGLRGETDTLEKMQKRVELDLQYINNWTLWLDIKILLRTPISLFSKDIY